MVAHDSSSYPALDIPPTGFVAAFSSLIACQAIRFDISQPTRTSACLAAATFSARFRLDLVRDYLGYAGPDRQELVRGLRVPPLRLWWMRIPRTT